MTTLGFRSSAGDRVPATNFLVQAERAAILLETLDEPAYKRKGKMIGDLEWERVAQVGQVHESGRGADESSIVSNIALTPRLEWTRHAPTDRGWYFHKPRQDATEVVAFVFLEQGETCLLDPSGHSYRLTKTIPGWWAGPIAEPLHA